MSDGDWGSGGGADWGSGGADLGGGGDSFTERSYQGWFSRLTGALIGIPIGLLMFLGSFVLLFWNEGRSVTAAKSLAEGKSAVVSIPADKVDSSNDGKLVHLSETATVDELVKDPMFLISSKALRLFRKASMYQWQEKKETRTRTRAGGGQERTTTYHYSKTWSSDAISSASFKQPSGHQNPPMSIHSSKINANVVKLGSFRLSEELLNRIDKSEPLPVTRAEFDALPDSLKSRFKLEGSLLYDGADPQSPAVGDTKVEFAIVPSQSVSLLAEQKGDSFGPYQTQAGNSIERLELGNIPADQMFAHAEAENKVLTWILRLVGFILMTVGIMIVLGPLKVFADVLPFIGSIVGMGTGFFALGVSIVLSPIVIGVAWLAYRPILGAGCLAGSLALLFVVTRLGRNRYQDRMAHTVPSAR
jgi:hypothetical protein